MIGTERTRLAMVVATTAILAVALLAGCASGSGTDASGASGSVWWNGCSTAGFSAGGVGGVTGGTLGGITGTQGLASNQTGTTGTTQEGAPDAHPPCLRCPWLPCPLRTWPAALPYAHTTARRTHGSRI